MSSDPLKRNFLGCIEGFLFLLNVSHDFSKFLSVLLYMYTNVRIYELFIYYFLKK